MQPREHDTKRDPGKTVYARDDDNGADNNNDAMEHLRTPLLIYIYL